MKVSERNEYGHITIYTRHSTVGKCTLTDMHDHSCRCAKLFDVQRTGHPRQRISAETNNLMDARARARVILESWSPAAQELARLKAADQPRQTTIRDAVTEYLLDFKWRHRDPNAETQDKREGANGTHQQYRQLLEKHWLTWLDAYNAARPLTEHIGCLSEITSDLMRAWVRSWPWGDLTCRNRVDIVRTFFCWLMDNGKITSNPTTRLEAPKKLERGNRTAIFTADQYTAILEAAGSFQPAENVDQKRKQVWSARVQIFLELMRWTGMAIIDAVQFSPASIDEEGTLVYTRHKTRRSTQTKATIPLQAVAPHMMSLLQHIPLEPGVSTMQPFRTQGIALESVVKKWRERLADIFEAAQVTEVVNNVGRKRKPHPHMLRDTFASYCLNDLDLELPDVAKMMGHANSSMTEHCYWPWVKERSEALTRRVREARTQMLRRQRKTSKIVEITQPERRVMVH